jgi:hypothetical protein
VTGPALSPFQGAVGPRSSEHAKPESVRSAYVGASASPTFNFDLDSAFLGLSESLPRTPDFSIGLLEADGQQAFGGASNLFPLLEAGGHIDLAHYF